MDNKSKCFGQVYLKIIEARGLDEKLLRSGTNLIVSASVIGNQKNQIKTKTIKDSLHPEWHQEFIISVPSSKSCIQLTLWRRRYFFQNKVPLGSCKISLKRLSGGKVFQGWYCLENTNIQIKLIIKYDPITLEHKSFTCCVPALRLALQRAIFYGGERIFGCVIHNVTKPYRTQGIKIAIEGLTRVFWTEGSGVSQMSYRAIRYFFQNEKRLFCPPPGLGKYCYTITGCHYYPFEFIIPYNILPSMKFGSGSIEYSIKVFDGNKKILQQNLWILAHPPNIPSSKMHHYLSVDNGNVSDTSPIQRLDSPSKSTRSKISFQSSSNSSMRSPPSPNQQLDQGYLNAPFRNSKKCVEIFGNLPTVVLTGEPLNFQALICNGTSNTISSIDIHLYFKLSVRGGNPWVVGLVEKTWLPRKVVVCEKLILPGFPVKPHSSWQHNVSVLIPPHLTISLEDSPLITTSWELKIFANVVSSGGTEKPFASATHHVRMATRNLDHPEIIAPKPPPSERQSQASIVNLLAPNKKIWKYLIPHVAFKKQKPIPFYGYKIPMHLLMSGNRSSFDALFQN